MAAHGSIDEQVFRLDVPVNDARGVHRGHAVQHLADAGAPPPPEAACAAAAGGGADPGPDHSMTIAERATFGDEVDDPGDIRVVIEVRTDRSRRKRATTSGSDTSSGLRTLTATGAPDSLAVPAYTSPMAPRPIGSCSRYLLPSCLSTLPL